MNRFKELNKRVLKWANDKEILEKSNPVKQIEKTLEEVNETYLALVSQKQGKKHYTNKNTKIVNTEAEIKDGFGDSLVTLLIGCKMQGLDPLDCLETALEVIEKRTGSIKNGTFVKD